MSSQIGIINVALGHVSAPTIEDMSEKSNEAAEANRFWASAVKTTLAGHDWRWASKIRTLTLNEDNNTGGWTFAYSYPPNCVKFREILQHNQAQVTDPIGFGQQFGSALGAESLYNFNRSMHRPRNDYIQSNKQGFGDSGEPVVGFNIGLNDADEKTIYSDVPNAVGRFTSLVMNTELFDALFENALQWYLASNFAIALKRDQSLMRTCMQVYEAKIAEARDSNVGEATGTMLEPAPSHIRARGGY